MKTLAIAMRFRAIAVLVSLLSAVSGRGASIRHCGFALPGDCRFCGSLLATALPVTLTFATSKDRA